MVHTYSQVHPNGVFTCDLKIKRCLAKNQNNSQCHRKSFRHPVCLQHARTLLGIEIRSSNTAGCGLFATRVFHIGDAICPYTGDIFDDLSHMQRVQNRAGSPYAVGFVNSRKATNIRDASCLRSFAAYANAPTRNRTNANAIFKQCTLNNSDMKTIDGLRGRANRWLVPNSNHLSAKGFKSFPVGLTSRMTGPYMWIRASKNINVGDEIFINYGLETSEILRVTHRTDPQPCR